MSNINLDGGETSVIRTLGFGGSPLMGRDLKSRVGGMGDAELFEILQTLIAIGYVCANRDLSRVEDLDRATFFTNPGYSKELKEALDPRAKEPPTRRVRRQ
jgi:hypothetical protein